MKLGKIAGQDIPDYDAWIERHLSAAPVMSDETRNKIRVLFGGVRVVQPKLIAA